MRYFSVTFVVVGTVLAMLLSWITYKSIVLMGIHGVLGWIYIIYHFASNYFNF